jgi:hypothetical protein
VKIDSNRNGVGATYITEVAKAADGSFYNKVVRVVPNITQTLGLPEAEFKKMGPGHARCARLPQVSNPGTERWPRSLRCGSRRHVPSVPAPGTHRPGNCCPVMPWRSAE